MNRDLAMSMMRQGNNGAEMLTIADAVVSMFNEANSDVAEVADTSAVADEAVSYEFETETEEVTDEAELEDEAEAYAMLTA